MRYRTCNRRKATKIPATNRRMPRATKVLQAISKVRCGLSLWLEVTLEAYSIDSKSLNLMCFCIYYLWLRSSIEEQTFVKKSINIHETNFQRMNKFSHYGSFNFYYNFQIRLFSKWPKEFSSINGSINSLSPP